jgi:hypothetical protein
MWRSGSKWITRSLRARQIHGRNVSFYLQIGIQEMERVAMVRGGSLR